MVGRAINPGVEEGILNDFPFLTTHQPAPGMQENILHHLDLHWKCDSRLQGSEIMSSNPYSRLQNGFHIVYFELLRVNDPVNVPVDVPVYSLRGAWPEGSFYEPSKSKFRKSSFTVC